MWYNVTLSSKNRRKERTEQRKNRVSISSSNKQFRQIDDKYGLIVSEHINDLYVHKRDNNA